MFVALLSFHFATIESGFFETFSGFQFLNNVEDLFPDILRYTFQILSEPVHEKYYHPISFFKSDIGN